MFDAQIVLRKDPQISLSQRWGAFELWCLKYGDGTLRDFEIILRQSANIQLCCIPVHLLPVVKVHIGR